MVWYKYQNALGLNKRGRSVVTQKKRFAFMR